MQKKLPGSYRFDDEEGVLVIGSHEVGESAVDGRIEADWSVERRQSLHTEAHDCHHDAEHRQQSKHLQRRHDHRRNYQRNCRRTISPPPTFEALKPPIFFLFCAAINFDFMLCTATYSYVLQLEMQLRLTCAMTFHLLTHLLTYLMYWSPNFPDPLALKLLPTTQGNAGEITKPTDFSA